MAKSTDNVRLPDDRRADGEPSTIFAEMIRSMERDGPLATTLSFLAVVFVVVIATHSARDRSQFSQRWCSV